MEITMIIGIIVYFLNFFTGKTKNQKIANQVRYFYMLGLHASQIFPININPLVVCGPSTSP